ncbi:MAG: hypothetical protein IRZ09_10655 [Variibacter sp.]|nr:hypothetical protein [Variibacter sp.]
MRKLWVAALAAFSLGALAPDRSQATPLGGTSGLRPAVDGLGFIEKVRYCEYFDPVIGGWVVFWVPGPCLRYGAPGFDIWLGRYYRGHRFWRGRAHDRPWVERRVGPRVAPGPRFAPGTRVAPGPRVAPGTRVAPGPRFAPGPQMGSPGSRAVGSGRVEGGRMGGARGGGGRGGGGGGDGSDRRGGGSPSGR